MDMVDTSGNKESLSKKIIGLGDGGLVRQIWGENGHPRGAWVNKHREVETIRARNQSENTKT